MPKAGKRKLSTVGMYISSISLKNPLPKIAIVYKELNYKQTNKENGKANV